MRTQAGIYIGILRLLAEERARLTAEGAQAVDTGLNVRAHDTEQAIRRFRRRLEQLEWRVAVSLM